MIVLGYNGFSRAAGLFERLYGHTADSVDRYCVLGHDAGAALIVDGELVAAVEEERLNRRKKTSEFPLRSIEYCLRQAGLTYADVDHFAFGWDFDRDYADSAIREIAESNAVPEQKFQALSAIGVLYAGAFSKPALLADFTSNTGHRLTPDRLTCVPHHHAHLACGRLLAGPGDAAFFISDGRSERHSAILGEVRGRRSTVFDELTIDMANSLGQLFAELTRYLGFVPNSDEYKVMGLAAYGAPPEPGTNPLLEKVLTLEDSGRFSLALAGDPRGTRAYPELFDQIFDGNDGNRQDFDFRVRVAAAAQQMVEFVTAHQVTALAARTDLRTLVFEGGLALNCVNNTKLLETLGFDRVEVGFGASDPGIAIGAAAHVSARDATPPDPGPGPAPYVGPGYSAAEIEQTLRGYRDTLTWDLLPGDEVVAKTAELLAGKVVIGWFQGRTEFGPRALGNRSILANPSYADMKDIINNRVKHREPFRPFAPVVLEADAARIFELGKKAVSPYMTFVFPVRPEFLDTIPAAVHVDGTARIQTVTEQSNPRLAALLRAFTARTAVPCLINTSFNVAGEPIVCSPKDAVECFLGTDIDYLVIGDYLVTKTAAARLRNQRFA